MVESLRGHFSVAWLYRLQIELFSSFYNITFPVHSEKLFPPHQSKTDQLRFQQRTTWWSRKHRWIQVLRRLSQALCCHILRNKRLWWTETRCLECQCTTKWICIWSSAFLEPFILFTAHITDADMKVTSGLKLRCKGPSLALNVRHFFLQPVAQWRSRNESGEVVSPVLYTPCILFLSDEGPMLETLDYTIRIGSTPTFLYFDLFWKTTFKVRPTFNRANNEVKYSTI